jgi:hypothetical protein
MAGQRKCPSKPNLSTPVGPPYHQIGTLRYLRLGAVPRILGAHEAKRRLITELLTPRTRSKGYGPLNHRRTAVDR